VDSRLIRTVLGPAPTGNRLGAEYFAGGTEDCQPSVIAVSPVLADASDGSLIRMVATGCAAMQSPQLDKRAAATVGSRSSGLITEERVPSPKDTLKFVV